MFTFSCITWSGIWTGGANAARTIRNNSVGTNTVHGLGASQQGSQDVVQFLRQKLILGNRAEIELGNLAKENADSAKVKEFADMMINDHSNSLQKLQGMTGEQRPARLVTFPGLVSPVIRTRVRSPKEPFLRERLLKERQHREPRRKGRQLA